MKYIFAGDRQISVNILSFLISKGYKPLALMLPDPISSSHSGDLKSLVPFLDQDHIIEGKNLGSKIAQLSNLDADYIFGIHYPYIIKSEILNIPRIRFLNLHPDFLPYNKGWHTPSWAILDNTPYGATLHFMTEGLDDGDIIHQKLIKIEKYDTANTLYKKVLSLEVKVFVEALDQLLSLNPSRVKQTTAGTIHSKKDLKAIQEIQLSDNYNVGNLLDKLRGLTTNNLNEAAFFTINGKKIAIQVQLTEIK